MPLVGWVLAGVVVAILVIVYALPWLSIVHGVMKASLRRTATPSPEVAQLAAELRDLEAKHPPHPGGS